jgi:hypothetical protein
MEKPFKGRLLNWCKDYSFKDQPDAGLGYYVHCLFQDHPQFATRRGHTSMVVAEFEPPRHANDERIIEIETLNSRYHLVGDPFRPDIPAEIEVSAL